MLIKFNALVPELLVTDLKKSYDFYHTILGFSIEYQRPEDSFVYLSYNGSHLMLEQDRAEESLWKVAPLEYPRGRGLNLSIDCPDATSLANKITSAGFPLQKPLEDKWYRQGEIYLGQRNFLVLDPDGYMLRFAEDLGASVTPK